MATRLLRFVYPAGIDLYSFSCTTVIKQSVRCIGSTHVLHCNNGPNEDVQVNPLFHNKNPRNLENMGLERKRQGWVLQFPRKDFYNKLVFKKSARHTSAYVQHSSGEIVASASTKEWAIRQHLYSCLDVSAAENVGRVLAQRCLECGLDHVFFDQSEVPEPSDALTIFLEAMSEGNLELEEPRQVKPVYQQGIDYNKPNRYGEKKQLRGDYQPS